MADDPFDQKEVTMEVGGRRLTIQALPFRAFRDAMRIVGSALVQVQEAARSSDMAIIQDIPAVILDKFGELAPILFYKQEVTREWVEENFSLPQARRALDAAARVNGVLDFLALQRRTGTAGDTPSSTTPSPSPTGGQSAR